MKVSFIVSEIENQFFFLSNLSEWHFSCRPDYNKAWLSSQKVSKNEREVLEDFKKVILKHGYEYKNGKNQYLGQAFYVPTERQKWGAVKSWVSPQDYRVLVTSFLYFENRFHKIWDAPLLQEWQNSLEKELKKPNIKRLFLMVEKFYGVSLPKVLRVHLIASPSHTRSVAGSANVGSGDIVLEVPIFDLKSWNVEFGIAILVHELIHTLIDKNSKVVSLIEKEISSQKTLKTTPKIFNRTTKEITKELVGELCAPFGYPCYKTFSSFEPVPDILIPNLVNRAGSFNTLIKRVIWNTYPLIGSYIEAGKTIDAPLIKRTIITLNDVLQEHKS